MTVYSSLFRKDSLSVRCVSHNPRMSKLNLLASSSSISQCPAVLSVLTFQVPIFNPQWLSGTFLVLGWQFVFGWRNVTFRLLTLLELCLGVFCAASSAGVVLFGVEIGTCGIGNKSSGRFFAPLPLCCQWAATGTRGRIGELTFMVRSL